ncbi:sulfate ABC transporter permease [Lichenihabitans psoromatis]|uniref:sulfate ABC transporter permease n=1 Tax=Lichenihabitans psoromatis TaxID=2528642 RepID=UPI001038525E|nr:ABC transporter permease subunit [Lichenihabitans psoromatis]
MAAAPVLGGALAGPVKTGIEEPRIVRVTLIALSIAFLTLFIVLPVANVFTQAFSKGVDAYVQTFGTESGGPPPKTILDKRRAAMKRAQVEKTWGAIRMSVGIAVVVVPLNIVFGLMAAWCVTKFRFRGRALLVALIDLPFSVSPVIAGLVFVLLLGRSGLFGAWATGFTWPDPTSLMWQGFAGHVWPLTFSRSYEGVIFTPLAIALASIFVTFPFVARAVIPLMQTQGSDEELAALSLGASGWRIFRTVTLPNIRWALLYGIILCTARAFGEFGAVSVVSGNVDSNDTMPLRIEKLWNEYDNQAAFTVASLLALLAVVTLVIKTVIDIKAARGRAVVPLAQQNETIR